jgi:hypothetical protein
MNKVIPKIPKELQSEYETLYKKQYTSNFTKEEQARLDEIGNLGEKPRKDELSKLEPYRNTWQDRIIREEIKQAAKDGKTALQFPTGETAMKIEGLGERNDWYHNPTGKSAFNGGGLEPLTADSLKVGQIIDKGGEATTNSEWIVTDVLGDGKFKAVSKSSLDYERKNEMFINQNISDERMIKELAEIGGLDRRTETFDISGKVDTNNPIYKFYEKEVAKYLKNKYKAEKVTDENGVTWFEVAIKPEMVEEPVYAFRRMEEKFPEFNSGNKLEDLKKTLAFAENRVGVKKFEPEKIQKIENMLSREERSLKEALNKPEAHLKAYGENRVPKYQKRIKELKERLIEAKNNEPIKKVVVSGKEIELPQELKERQIELEIRREVLDNNPLKKLLKYVSRRGHDAGTLPEIGSGTSKFRKHGDAIIQQAMYEFTNAKDAPHDEDVRANMEFYLRDRQNLMEEEAQLARDIRTFMQAAKDELALIKITEQQANKIQNDIKKEERVRKLEKKAREEALAKQRKEIEKKERKYGFTVPKYAENEFPEIGQLIAVEDQLRVHPARPFLKYINKRTGKLPQIIKETPGVYGAKMSELLKKKGYSSVEDAQKAVDNYIALSDYLSKLVEDRFDPVEFNDSPTVNTTPVYETEKQRLETDPQAPDLNKLAFDSIPFAELKRKVAFYDFLRTIRS